MKPPCHPFQVSMVETNQIPIISSARNNLIGYQVCDTFISLCHLFVIIMHDHSDESNTFL